MIYLLTVIGLTPGGSSTVRIYTQTIHRKTQLTQTIHRTTQLTQTIHRTTQLTQTLHRTTQLTNWEGCGPCPVLASYTLALALQLRKKRGKTSVRVAEDRQLKPSSAETCCYVLLINYILCIWFAVHRAVHRNTISIVKPTRYTNVSDLFIFGRHSTCCGRSFRPSSGVQDCTHSNRHMSNIYCCLLATFIYFILEWHSTRFGRSFRPPSGVQDCTHSNRHLSNSKLASRQQYLFDICLLLYVQSWTPDDGRKDRPKHVECQSKIK